MPVRLDWRLGTEGDQAPEAARAAQETMGDDPWREGEPPSPAGASGTAGAPFARLLGLLLLLVLAGAGGFFLGRWAEAQRFVVHGIESQLALEQLAWREGDQELYITTLDPMSTVEWRSAKVFEFLTGTPQRWEARIVELLPMEEGRRMQVTVEISSPGRPAEATVRFYELREHPSGSRWLRSEP